MTENQRPPRCDIVDELVFIRVPNVRTLAAHNKRWLASHGTKGTHRRVHSARNHAFGPQLQTARLLGLAGRCGWHQGSHVRKMSMLGTAGNRLLYQRARER